MGVSRPSFHQLCSRIAAVANARILNLLFLASALALFMFATRIARAQESVIWTFAGQYTDGASPSGGLISDAEGNLYGTTAFGGANGYGSVFELSPGTGGKWKEKLLWSFNNNGTDGFEPVAGLVFDTNGNLYGTTETGGNGEYTAGGTVFELSPGAGGVWKEKILYNFGSNSTDGFSPEAALIIDDKGNLYGTTSEGGAGTGVYPGTVFELSPGTAGKWTRKTLWNFNGGAKDGRGPQGSLIFDAKGNLYGTAAYGMVSASTTTDTGPGMVFELSPGTGTLWTEKILRTFGQTLTDSANPASNLIFDSNGNLYGTTLLGGGIDQSGSVFELSPGTGGEWTEKLLYGFSGEPSDGASPGGGLIFDNQGNLYGTTSAGGVNSNNGTVFELSPGAGETWSEKYLYTFGATSTDGIGPNGSLLADAAGNLYGATGGGGLNDGSPNDGSGTVFKIAGLIKPAAATPTFSVAAGTYDTTQTVKISDTTAGATIYYTTNDTTPTTSSTKYTEEITVSATETIEAIAVATGVSPSAVASATYTIEPQAETPTIAPPAGAYSAPLPITITDSTPGATIYYTTNGTTPSSSSTKYTVPFNISASTTVQAIAIAPDYVDSDVASAAYIIGTPTATPTFSVKAGTYTTAQSVSIDDATKGAVIYYTTDGIAPTTASTKYTKPLTVSTTETVEAMAVASGDQPSAVFSAAYVIETPAATPVITPKAGDYSTPQPITITDSTAGAIIYYTTNGTMPSATSTQYIAAFNISASTTVKAIAIATGFTNSAVASAAYVFETPTDTPAISPAAGTYKTGESITIKDGTKGAEIYYTTNGTKPTTASTKYKAAFKLSASSTVQAIAVATGHTLSAVASNAYVIEKQTATPTFSIKAGTYSKAQSVTLKDSTAGALIYYTTNNTTPTTASTQYTAAIKVSATETIKAVAVATGDLPSATATEKYTIK
jgi:uncharacterized repeat protein (TIGR03803 family)